MPGWNLPPGVTYNDIDPIDCLRLSSRVVKAKKQYKCMECRDPILPGQLYRRDVWLVDGEIQTDRSHTFLQLTPAYGRDYKSAKAAIQDFLANNDFICNAPFGPSGTYCNKQDFSKIWPNLKYVKLRYNKLQDCVIINIQSGEIEK